MSSLESLSSISILSIFSTLPFVSGMTYGVKPAYAEFNSLIKESLLIDSFFTVACFSMILTVGYEI